jgi:hypothetical protein
LSFVKTFRADPEKICADVPIFSDVIRKGHFKDLFFFGAGNVEEIGVWGTGIIKKNGIGIEKVIFKVVLLVVPSWLGEIVIEILDSGAVVS